MPKIKNKHYREFLDKGVIKTISESDLNLILGNIKHKHQQEARAVVIALYYTGARPNEVLRLKAKDLIKDKNYLKISIEGSKGGNPRPITIPFKNRPLISELLAFAESLYCERFLFFHFKSKYVRKYITKKGIPKEANETSALLRYHFYKWSAVLFEQPTSPYFLRHNRFTKEMEAGATLEEVRQLKGSKTYDSIMPYAHLSTNLAKKIGRRIK